MFRDLDMNLAQVAGTLPGKQKVGVIQMRKLFVAILVMCSMCQTAQSQQKYELVKEDVWHNSGWANLVSLSAFGGKNDGCC